MGTNYYVRTGKKIKKVCDCGFTHNIDEVLHVGKNSYGWCFLLQTYPDRNINELKDWMPILKAGEIYDEYGEKISARTMISRIKKKLTAEERAIYKRMSARKRPADDYGCTIVYNSDYLMRTTDNAAGKEGNYALESRDFE